MVCLPRLLSAAVGARIRLHRLHACHYLSFMPAFVIANTRGEALQSALDRMQDGAGESPWWWWALSGAAALCLTL